MTAPTAAESAPAGRLPAIVAIAALGGLILLVHGPALQSGLFMDDHAHFQQLRECGWSLGELTEACRLELVGGVIELWWLPETTLRFFRPVAFGLMKLTYTITGWNPTAAHAASLLWHWAACTLLMMLLRRVGASAWLAAAVAALFAVHPGHMATVQWIACQTELMVTTFLLGATLCFARFRGWPGFGGRNREHAAAGGAGWAVASVLFFALALGCRENALLFPLVVAAVEPLVWRQRTRATALLYGVLGVVIVAYLALRGTMLGGVELPPRPYVMPPGAPGFARFVFDKLWYYLLGEYLLVPCVPIGGLPYFQARPLWFYGLAAPIGVLLLVLCGYYFRRRPGLIGPAWLLGFFVPLLPVFASPHHLYLPGVGWAITMMLLLRGLGGLGRRLRTRLARWRATAVWCLIVLMGGVFFSATAYFGLAFETGRCVEDCLVEEIVAAPGGLNAGDTLYIANLPLVGHYAKLAVEERTGLRDLRVIPLTWAPRILGVATPTERKQVDDRTLEVHMAGDRYFAGPLARLIEEATGGPVPDELDRTADLGFRVRVLARDADGISALRFEFTRPLTDPGIHLFWGSRSRWASEPVKLTDE